MQTYALVSGALPTSWLLGFVVAAVSGGNVVINLIGHVLFGALLFRSLARLGARVRRQEVLQRKVPASLDAQSLPA